MIAVLSAFALYLCALICIGLYSYSRIQDSSDFLLGGRGINYVVTALSAHASDMSSWLFFGLPAAIYFHGVTECWAPVGLLLGMWATWHFIAPRLRTASEQLKSVTLTHFLAKSAHARSHTLIVFSSLLLVFFFLFYLAAGLKGIGIVLEFAFGIPSVTGIVISAVVVMLYTMLGGYLAVALTDAFQAVFLLCMIILVPVITWLNIPSDSITDIIASHTQLVPTFSWVGITTALGWGLGYCGMPHVLTKFMSIDSVKNMKKAQYVGLFWQLIALSSSAAIGLLAQSYFSSPPSSGEHLFMVLVTDQFTPLLAGFVLCAILAATISTLDAQLIVCATVITRDLCQPRSSTAQVRITRASIALLSTLAVLIAVQETQTLYEIVRYAWSGLGATFGPLMIMSLYARAHLTERKAVFGMLAGGLTAALWPHYGSCITHAPLIPGLPSTLL